MNSVILFGTGSSIVVDFEESLQRAGLSIAAGICNRPGPSYLSIPATAPEQLSADMLDLPFLVPLFTPGHRYQALLEARELGLNRPSILVDASVPLPRNLKLEAGTYINSGCSLGAASSFGAFAFINRGASIGHHVELGSFVSVGPGAVIAGHVRIGPGAVIGAGATVLPNIAIGANAVVGAGAVVTHDVREATLVLGNPARVAREDIRGYRGLTIA